MSERRPAAGRVPDLLVERLHLGELDPAQAARVRARLEAEGGLDRLAQLERSDAEILAAHPPADVAKEIAWRARAAAQHDRTAAGERSTVRRAMPWMLPALAAAGLVVVAVTRGDRGASVEATRAGDEPDTTREKGLRPHLVLYLAEGLAARPLRDGDAARRGDLVQIAYVSAHRPWGAILSIDGRGGVTLHLPEQPARGGRLAPRGEVTLSHSYELDDAPEYERFIFVTSEAPFDVEALLAAARRLAAGPGAAREPLALAPGLDQSPLLVRKVRP